MCIFTLVRPAVKDKPHKTAHRCWNKMDKVLIRRTSTRLRMAAFTYWDNYLTVTSYRVKMVKPLRMGVSKPFTVNPMEIIRHPFLLVCTLSDFDTLCIQINPEVVSSISWQKVLDRSIRLKLTLSNGCKRVALFGSILKLKPIPSEYQYLWSSCWTIFTHPDWNS